MAERNYWMIGADGKSYGPTDEETLVRWIHERRVTPSTQISEGPDGPWKNAGQWSEFAGALGVDTASAPAFTGAPAAAGASGAAAAPAPSVAAAPPLRPMPVAAQLAEWPPTNLQIVLLIGGIVNLLAGAGGVLWATLFGVASFGLGCLCGLPAIIPFVAGILQIVDYTSAARTEPKRYLDRTQMWGIINIVLIITGNVGSLICGILQLVWLGDARRRYISQ